ncbi:MAG: hypothetical protein V7760_03735 [Marinobacter sp.]
MNTIRQLWGGLKRSLDHRCRELAAALVLIALPATTLALPDLTVQLQAPKTAMPGTDIGKNLTVTVYNRGDVLAAGTRTSSDGYMVDLFITRGTMPTGYARYDEHYFDGVLLKGGRISNTIDLPARQSIRYGASAILPSDISSGGYQLCARVDPGAKQPEANETNNTRCVELRVIQLAVVHVLPSVKLLLPEHRDTRLQVVQPDSFVLLQKPATEPQPVGASEATRTIMADGTIVMSWPDGSQRQLKPNGKVVYVSPDGQIMTPFAMQVQGAELPALPDSLGDWGKTLANDLLRILTNILTDAEMAAFQKTEEGKDYYELIDWRLRSIAFLTAYGEQ